MEIESTATAPEDLLYHYTSLDAFLSIVKKGELWASDLNVVNDPAELGHVRQRFYSLCKGIGEAEDADSQRRDFASRIVGFLEHLEKNSTYFVGRIFAVSFCRHGDLLSQWRAYGLEGNGVCIGFSANEMKSCFGGATKLMKVSYSDDELNRFVSKLFEDAYSTYASESGNFITAAGNIVSAFFDRSHEFKLSAFSEEAESRLVHLWGGMQQPWDVELRVKAHNLIPYIVQKPTTGILPIRKVITGPAFKSPGSVYALKGLLESKRFRDVTWDKSAFTLR